MTKERFVESIENQGWNRLDAQEDVELWEREGGKGKRDETPWRVGVVGGPKRKRTSDPQFRKLMLYPAEL